MVFTFRLCPHNYGNGTVAFDGSDQVKLIVPIPELLLLHVCVRACVSVRVVVCVCDMLRSWIGWKNGGVDDDVLKDWCSWKEWSVVFSHLLLCFLSHFPHPHIVHVNVADGASHWFNMDEFGIVSLWLPEWSLRRHMFSAWKNVINKAVDQWFGPICV